MRLVAPETITFTQSGFCPGCGHGLAVRLIAEVMEEMGLSEKLLAIVGVYPVCHHGFDIGLDPCASAGIAACDG